MEHSLSSIKSNASKGKKSSRRKRDKSAGSSQERAKNENRKNSRSTAAADGPPPDLSQLEADVLSKARSRPDGATGALPGASGGGSLDTSDLSSTRSGTDAKTKSRARRVKGSVVKPGVVDVAGAQAGEAEMAASTPASAEPQLGGVEALNRLEQDVQSKTRLRPGAVASSGGRKTGKSSGRSSSSRSAASSASGAVASSGGERPQKPPGRTVSQETVERRLSSSSGAQSSLRNLEDEIVAKSSRNPARRSATSSRVGPGPRGPSRNSDLAPSGLGVSTVATAATAEASSTGYREEGMGSGPPELRALSSMRNLEADVLAKHQAVPPPSGPTTAQVESERATDPSPDIEAANGESVNNEPARNSVDGQEEDEPLVSQFRSNRSLDPDEPPQDPPHTAPEPHAAQGPGPLTVEHSSGAAYSAQHFGADTGGLEAFVADKVVVEATGVAVLLSDEEEAKLEQKKYRWYMFIGLLAFVLISVIIVVPVVLLAGGDPSSPPPTNTPTLAPTDSPTSSPTTQRFNDFLLMVESISEVESLADPSSAQYKAALWVADEDVLQRPLDSPEIVQRYILATFYFALGGESWLNCRRTDAACEQHWLGRTSECDWRYVSCDGNGQVTQLAFNIQGGNEMKGQIPHEVSQLSELRGLTLQRNMISGTFPSSFGKLTKLTLLFLHKNELTGSLPGEELGKMTDLQRLFLDSNSFNGTLPMELGVMPNLTYFRCNNNEFSGTIPKLSNLVDIIVDHNKLTGSIPDSLYENTKLMVFRANNNLLTGALSSRIGNMVSINSLRLGWNKGLGETLPEELFTLPNIAEFNITSCNFTGTLSEAIAQLNDTITDLILENNLFFGPLPKALYSLGGELRELTLHENDFTGTIASSDLLCQRRGESIKDLSNLTADCGPANVKVTCDCCTCFPW